MARCGQVKSSQNRFYYAGKINKLQQNKISTEIISQKYGHKSGLLDQLIIFYHTDVKVLSKIVSNNLVNRIHKSS